MRGATLRSLPTLWFYDLREKYWLPTCLPPTNCEVRADLPNVFEFQLLFLLSEEMNPCGRKLNQVSSTGPISDSSGKLLCNFRGNGDLLIDLLIDI